MYSYLLSEAKWTIPCKARILVRIVHKQVSANRCQCTSNINYTRNCMIGQVNSVLCHFGKLPSSVKSKLLYAYCSSLYECELWDLWNKNIDTVCVAWRKALRRVWNLPFNTHCALPVYDVICKRVLSFITKCVHSDCYVVICSTRNSTWSHDFTNRAQCFVLWLAI